jgi:hypothetical protein
MKTIKNILDLVEKVSIPANLYKVDLDHSKEFLELISSANQKRVVIDDFNILEPWAILLLAAVGRRDDEGKVFIQNLGTTKASNFAHSLGLDAILNNQESESTTDKKRTVKICKINDYNQIEPISDKISKLIIKEYENEKQNNNYEKDEVRKVLRYVLVELLRNVTQHSYDPKGGLVVAQRMNKENDGDDNARIQIAVVDTGIGIYDSLITSRPEITDPVMALERAIWPSYSGKFTQYQTGSSQNAGMGLFFVSEMAKLTAGKMLIASKGATLFIEGDKEYMGNNKIATYTSEFNGTIVAFEMPKRGVDDYDSLIKTIREKAQERKSKKQNISWIRFDIPPDGAIEFYTNIASENTIKAEEFAKAVLLPRINNKQIIVLNFTNLTIGTQSFMHSLLYEAIKTAYRLNVPLYAKNVSPSVKDQIKMVEGYGLE